MSKITDLHEAVYDYLLRKKQHYLIHKKPLLYTLRIENKGKLLDRGYWFYGSEKAVFISFWSGNDWLNETPNMYIAIGIDEQYSLHFSAGDSRMKASMFNNIFVPPLQLSPEKENGWIKRYPKGSLISFLDHFLENDKASIDKLIALHPTQQYMDDPTNPISFIDEQAFETWRNTVEKIRDKNGIVSFPYVLTNFKAEQFPPIRSLTLGQVPKESPFIFLVGENGTGKTSVLRALANGIGYKYREKRFEDGNPAWQVSCWIKTPTDSSVYYRINDRGVMTDSPVPDIPFACYGAMRLDVDDRKYSSTTKSYSFRTHPFHSLYAHDGIFLNLNRWLINGLANKVPLANERYLNIKKMLITLIPNIYDIQERPWNGTQELVYYERGSNGEEIDEPVTFRNLSSGIKSLLILLGDMTIRLFEQQPEIKDVSRLTGIVLIDEIDIHLHPKWQRKVPQILHEFFPYVQFIATTHSPIPLLGAPKNSRIFKVKRDHKLGVTIERIDNQIKLENLLPNTILSSPIFGFEDIIPESNEDLRELRTEDTYKEVELNELTRKELKKIARRIRSEKN